MKWTPFEEVKDCGILEYDRHIDDRGYFQELWNRKECASNLVPLPWGWAQDNVSYTAQGVLRGFHIQRNNPQGKLITCLSGKILDVCLDLRLGSPTFLRMTRFVLDALNPVSFWLPPGTAHAFLAIEDSFIHYKCSTPYDKVSDGGVNASSAELAMVWPYGNFRRSEKDMNLPPLSHYLQSLQLNHPIV